MIKVKWSLFPFNPPLKGGAFDHGKIMRPVNLTARACLGLTCRERTAVLTDHFSLGLSVVPFLTPFSRLQQGMRNGMNPGLVLLEEATSWMFVFFCLISCLSHQQEMDPPPPPPPLVSLSGRTIFVVRDRLHLVKNMLYFPLLVLKGIYHCWKYVYFFGDLSRANGGQVWTLFCKSTPEVRNTNGHTLSHYR